MIKTITTIADFPRKVMKHWTHGTPEQAQKLFPQNTIYVYHQKPRGSIIMIDPDLQTPPDRSQPTDPPNLF